MLFLPGQQESHLFAGFGDDLFILRLRGSDALELELDQVVGECPLGFGQRPRAFEDVLAVLRQRLDGFARPVQFRLVTVQVLPEIRTVVKTVREFQRVENHCR